MIQSFDNWKSPEYQEVKFKTLSKDEEIIEAQKKRKVFEDNDNFLTTNHDYIYSNVLGKVYLNQTKPKKKPNLIGLESVHIIDEPLPEHLRIADVEEAYFRENLDETIEHIKKHFIECRQSFEAFDQFKPMLSGNIFNRIKKYTEKKKIDL